MGLYGLALAVDPEDLAPPLAGLDESQEQPDRGRLARPIGTQVADHFAAGDVEVEAVKCGGDIPVAFGKSLGSNGADIHRQPPIDYTQI